MRRNIAKCVVVLLLAVCMNMTTQAAYYAYTKTVKNQIRLMEVSEDTVSLSMFGLKNDDFADTTASGSNASESNASESTASGSNAEIPDESKMNTEAEIASDSNAIAEEENLWESKIGSASASDAERAIASDSNAESI